MTDWDKLSEQYGSGGGSADPTPAKTDWDKLSDQYGEGAPPQINVVEDSSQAAGFGDIAVASMASDGTEAIRWYASKMYPKEPLKRSTKRFGVKNGTLYHRPDLSKPDAYPVIPQDWSLKSMGKKAMAGVGPSIPAVTGTATGIVTSPLMVTGVGTAATVGATAAAGYGGDVARQELGDWFMGDASTKDINHTAAIAEGIIEGTGQGIGKGLSVLTERGLAKDYSRFNANSTREAYDAAERSGIKITPGEATNLPSLKAEQKRLGNIVDSSDDAAKFYEKRDSQVFRAWDNFLNTIAKNGDVDEVGLKARDAAQKAVDTAILQRSSKAAPLYKKAFDGGGVIDSRNAISVARGNIIGKGKLKTTMGRVLNLLTDAVKDDKGKTVRAPVTNLKELHYAKLEIDRLIETAGQNSLGKTVKRKLIDVQKALVADMKTGSPDYESAMRIFREESPQVDDIVSSSVRLLADLKDTALIKASKTILDSSKRTPGSIHKARQAMEAADPQAWAGVKRVFLQDAIDKAWRITESSGINNPAGKLYKTLMSPQSQRTLMAAMKAPEFERFKELMDVMKTVSRVKPIGSDTEWNRLMTDASKERARVPFLSRMMETDITRPLKIFNDWLVEKRMSGQAQKMADIVFSGDKNSVNQLKELRKLNPGGLMWRAAVGHLLMRGGDAALDVENY